MTSPFIMTICDADNSKVDALRSSLNNNLFVLKAYSQTLGNLSKIFRIRDFLKSANHLADDTIIVSIDAFDVLCIRNDMEQLAADFHATGQDLIVGAESIFCHHRSEVLPFFLEKYIDTPIRYLNGGFIIAYKWAFLKMLNQITDNFIEEYMFRHNHTDQRALSTFMLKNSTLGLIKMDLDSTQKFCHTHTYADNPLCLKKIHSYFVHVTWLALEIQYKAYGMIKEHFQL